MDDPRTKLTGTSLAIAIGVVFATVAIAFQRPILAQEPARDSAAIAAVHAGRVDTTYRRESWREFALGIVGPRPLVRSAALAGLDQWLKRPTAYPQTWRGFGDRLGSRYAQVAISHTLRFGLARAFDEHTMRYRPCVCGDSGSRLEYALLAPLRVSTPAGVRLSILNPLTEITSGILVTGAKSSGFDVRDGVRIGLSNIALESALSLVREFWPWKRRLPYL